MKAAIWLTTKAQPTMMTSKTTDIACLQAHIKQQLQALTAELKAPSHLEEAMAYSLLAPGKYLRPLLTYGTGLALSASIPQLDHAAMAIECVHCYSLIHDDLPAMDDADTRRGIASNHKRFGEAQAILVGDGLLSLAFECLSEPQVYNPTTAIQLVRILASTSGASGMVAGQWIDMDPSPKQQAQIETMHQLKTGALFKACLQMACTISERPWTPTWEQLSTHIGLCYQLQDDLLDSNSCEEITGKPSGQDARHGKSTLTQSAAQQQLSQHLQHIQACMLSLGLKHPLLHDIIDLIGSTAQPCMAA